MKKILLVILILAIAITLCACRDIQDMTLDEWISPDGVHYWCHTDGYTMRTLAPRYDSEGNLVIDKP